MVIRERADLVGGGDLCLMLKSEEVVNCVSETNQLCITTVLEEVAEAEELLEELPESSLLVNRSKDIEYSKVKTGVEAISDAAENKESVVQQNKDGVIDDVMENMTQKEKDWVLSQVKSAQSLKSIISERRRMLVK